jgi:hypothetical protein
MRTARGAALARLGHRKCSPPFVLRAAGLNLEVGEKKEKNQNEMSVGMSLVQA